MPSPNADIVLRGAIRGGLLVVGGAAEGRAPDPIAAIFPGAVLATALVAWCAAEIPPPASFPSGPRIACSSVLPIGPFRAFDPDQVADLFRIASDVADELRQGRHVFVASSDGRQRAPLVAALAVHLIDGQGGLPAMARIRALRISAPSNAPVLDHPACEKLLALLPARDGMTQLTDLSRVVLR